MKQLISNIEKHEADYIAFLEKTKEQLFKASRIPESFKGVNCSAFTTSDQKEAALNYYNSLMKNK